MDIPDSFFDIIKDAFRKSFETESSTETGRVNLITGLLLFGLVIILTASGTLVDKIMFLINNEYELGMDWYVILIMFVLVFIYFGYCIHKVSSVNDVNNTDQIE